MKKKGLILSINDFKIINISNNIVKSKVNTSVKVNTSNKIGSFLSKIFKEEKSINLSFLTQTRAKLNGSFLSFELLSLDINSFIKIKEVKGLLKEKIENIRIPIKKLEKISWFATVKSIYFHDNGDLEIGVGMSKLIIFLLIPLFLLREIGLFFIYIYQKVISPKKGVTKT